MWSLTPFFFATSSSTFELVRLWQEKAIWLPKLSCHKKLQFQLKTENFQLSGFKESDDSEEVILEPRLIAVILFLTFFSLVFFSIIFQVEYMKTWFFLDLLSSLPVDYIFLILDSGLLETNLVKALSLQSQS